MDSLELNSSTSARDIAATEAHVANLKQLQLGLAERIGNEELALRKLVA